MFLSRDPIPLAAHRRRIFGCRPAYDATGRRRQQPPTGGGGGLSARDTIEIKSRMMVSRDAPVVINTTRGRTRVLVMRGHRFYTTATTNGRYRRIAIATNYSLQRHRTQRGQMAHKRFYKNICA